MKLKGISLFEQHVEKLVLGLFTAVAVVLFVLQFASPNTVEIGGKDFAPEQIGGEIGRLATQKLGRIEGGGFPAGQEPPAVAGIDDPNSASVEELFSGLSAVLYPEAAIARENDPGSTDLPMPGATEITFAVVTPPAPDQPVAISEITTIDPVVPVLFPEAASLLPARQPMDEWYVSVSARFDTAELRSLLEAVPDDENIAPMPRSWWDGMMELVDVVWVRERQLADGSWGERTTLDPLPGRDAMREMIAREDLVPANLPEVLEAEASLRGNIRRPDFYPTITGPDWVHPAGYIEAFGVSEEEGVVAGAGQLSDECRELVSQARRNADRARRLQQSMERLIERRDNIGREDEGEGGGRGRASLTPQPGLTWPEIPETWMAQAGRNPDEAQDDGDATDRRRQRIQVQIDRIEAQINELRAELEEACLRLQQECDTDCTELLGFSITELGGQQGAGGGAIRGGGRQPDRGGDDTGGRNPGLGIDRGGAPFDDGNDDFESAGQVPVFDEPLGSLLQMEEGVTLWAHDLSVVPGETYRYRATVRLINPFFASVASLGESQREIAEDLTVDSAPSAWSEPTKVLPETVIVVESASAASSAAGIIRNNRRPASASLQVYRFFYGYWRQAGADVNPGDRIRASVELPELPTFAIEAGSGEPNASPTVTEGDAVERTLAFISDLFMTAVVESRDRRSAYVLLSSLDGRTSLEVTGEGGSALQRILRSLDESEGAFVRQPGTGVAPNAAPGGRGNPGFNPRDPGFNPRDPGFNPRNPGGNPRNPRDAG